MFADFLSVTLDPVAARVFFVLTLPICVWVALSDLKHMKIRNNAIIALLAIYPVSYTHLTLPTNREV